MIRIFTYFEAKFLQRVRKISRESYMPENVLNSHKFVNVHINVFLKFANVWNAEKFLLPWMTCARTAAGLRARRGSSSCRRRKKQEQTAPRGFRLLIAWKRRIRCVPGGEKTWKFKLTERSEPDPLQPGWGEKDRTGKYRKKRERKKEDAPWPCCKKSSPSSASSA